MAKRKQPQNWDDLSPQYDDPDPRSAGQVDDNYVLNLIQEAQMMYQEGKIEEAIDQCEEIVAVYNSAEAEYTLAFMYQEQHIWDAAVEHYTVLLDNPEYALSCYYSLGQCFRSKGDLQTASQYFDEAVDRVNLDMLNRDEADQLIQLCSEAARAHDDMNEYENSESIYNSLLGYLRSRGWKDSVRQVENLMAKSARPAQENSKKMPATPSNSGPEPVSTNSAKNPSVSPNASFSGSKAQQPVPSQLVSDQPGPMAPNNHASAPHLTIPGQQYQPPPPMNPGAFLQDMYPAAQQPFPMQRPSAPAGENRNPGFAGGLNIMPPPPMPEPQRTRVMQMMRNIESFIARGLYTAAIEECISVTEIAPHYLDVHLELAEIYVQQNKIDQAITKYAVLIDNFLASGRIDEAIAAYRRVLQLEPNNISYRVRLINTLAQHNRIQEAQEERIKAAEAFLNLGYPDRAIEQFEQSILTSPNDTRLRLNYALALIRAGKIQFGVTELQRILQIDPGNVIALARWQIALCLGGSAGAPAIAAAKAPDTRAAAIDVLNRLARILRSDGLKGYDDTLSEYTATLSQQQTNNDIRYGYAVMLHTGSKFQEAIAAYQSAQATPGLEVLSLVGIGLCYLNLNENDKAARSFEDASSLARSNPVPLAMWNARPRLDNEDIGSPDIEISQLLARAYQRSNPGGFAPLANASAPQKGSHQSSVILDEVYRAINEISMRKPNDVAGALQEMAQLAVTYRTQRRYEHALAALQEIAAIAPKDYSVHAEMADIHIHRGFLEEGIAELRKVYEIHMSSGQISSAAQALLQISDIQWQMGEHNDGMATLKQTLQLTPDDMNARQIYVQYCLEENKRSEAAEQQSVLARYYFHNRQTKEAVAMLQQLIALDKNNFDAYDLLGQTYFSVGEYEQAQRVYRHLAKINPASQVARERLAQIQEVHAKRG